MSSPINRVDFRTDPAQYRHWRLTFDGAVATLAMDVAEDGGLRPGYKLKLNSYDLGVDIELHDALQRIRFEHPEVRSVVVTSMKERIFCSGANIFMLGLSSHAWKVNFCKFTNETRNGMEALDLARKHRPDLILMDIQLPEVSGLEVTKWLKEDDELHVIPVIAVTAFAMKGDEERIRQGGCEAYVSKPISVPKFIEVIKTYLGDA